MVRHFGIEGEKILEVRGYRKKYRCFERRDVKFSRSFDEQYQKTSTGGKGNECEVLFRVNNYCFKIRLRNGLLSQKVREQKNGLTAELSKTGEFEDSTVMAPVRQARSTYGKVAINLRPENQRRAHLPTMRGEQVIFRANKSAECGCWTWMCRCNWE